MEKFINDYQTEITKLSRSVLLELMTILKAYSQALTLIGGWAPYFILQKYQKDKGFEHIGSIDIDLVINPELISPETYATIVELIERHNYKPRKNKLEEEIPFSFEREIEGKMVNIDFLSKEYFQFEKRHRKIQSDLKARTMKGCNMAIKHYFTVELKGLLPNSGEVKAKIRVADLIGCLVTKGIVLGERYKEKDAYDIYAVISNYKEGSQSCAEEIKPFVKNKIVKEALDSIQEKFDNIRSAGPAWAGMFIHPEDEEARKRIIAEAYLKVKKFLELIKEKPLN